MMEQEPEFLRPDALLVVVFVSDENDCSSPSDNPNESSLPICKYQYEMVNDQGMRVAIDSDGDGIPDGYNDQELCPGLSPAACYARDCNGYATPNECEQARCRVDVATDAYYCAHYPESLTDVVDYARFLENLKANPLEQLVIATIVGPRSYTEAGNSISYGPLTSPLQPMCTAQNGMIQDVPDNIDTLRSEACCPGGQCVGPVNISCSSGGNGIAYSGRRYLQLAELFGNNGIGCPEVLPGASSVAQDSACQGFMLDSECGWLDEDGVTQRVGKCRPIVGSGGLSCSECLSICEESFERPLQAIKSKVAEILATYCLDKPPACRVADGYCSTPAQIADPANYVSSIQVTMQCRLTEAQGGRCEQILEPRALRPDEWVLELGAGDCTGGALVRLNDPPPAGAEIFVEFLVQVDDGEGGQEQGAPPAMDAGLAPLGDDQ
jgi:hypothetical protein